MLPGPPNARIFRFLGVNEDVVRALECALLATVFPKPGSPPRSSSNIHLGTPSEIEIICSNSSITFE